MICGICNDKDNIFNKEGTLLVTEVIEYSPVLDVPPKHRRSRPLEPATMIIHWYAVSWFENLSEDESPPDNKPEIFILSRVTPIT